MHLTNIASRDSFLPLSNSGPSCSPRGTQDMGKPWSERLAGFQSQPGHFTCPVAPQSRFPHLHNEGWAGWCVREGLCLACPSVLGMEALLKSGPCWAPAPAAYKRAQPPAPSSSGFFGSGHSFIFSPWAHPARSTDTSVAPLAAPTHWRPLSLTQTHTLTHHTRTCLMLTPRPLPTPTRQNLGLHPLPRSKAC